MPTYFRCPGRCFRTGLDANAQCEMRPPSGPDVWISRGRKRTVASANASRIHQDTILSFARFFFYVGSIHCLWCVYKENVYHRPFWDIIDIVRCHRVLLFGSLSVRYLLFRYCLRVLFNIVDRALDRIIRWNSIKWNITFIIKISFSSPSLIFDIQIRENIHGTHRIHLNKKKRI